jgi:[ribosomal protein S5]-alanine N-acetyltransferase
LGFGLWVIEKLEENEFAGFTGFATPGFESFFMPRTEIGWRLRKSIWGQGLASEAALACLEFGFPRIGFERVHSFTSA